jgi:hypothetical protein
MAKMTATVELCTYVGFLFAMANNILGAKVPWSYLLSSILTGVKTIDTYR